MSVKVNLKEFLQKMRKLSASMFSSKLVKAYQKGKARVELIGSPKTKMAR